jgi:hypothetical protein
MNAFSALIKCAATGFLVGLLASNGPELRINLFPLVGAIAVISAVFVLFEMMNLEPITSDRVDGRRRSAATTPSTGMI